MDAFSLQFASTKSTEWYNRDVQLVCIKWHFPYLFGVILFIVIFATCMLLVFFYLSFKMVADLFHSTIPKSSIAQNNGFWTKCSFPPSNTKILSNWNWFFFSFEHSLHSITKRSKDWYIYFRYQQHVLDFSYQ